MSLKRTSEKKTRLLGIQKVPKKIAPKIWAYQMIHYTFLVTKIQGGALKFSRAIFQKGQDWKKIQNYIFATRKVWCTIWCAQILGAIFFGTFWISTNREPWTNVVGSRTASAVHVGAAIIWSTWLAAAVCELTLLFVTESGLKDCFISFLITIAYSQAFIVCFFSYYYYY